MLPLPPTLVSYCLPGAVCIVFSMCACLAGRSYHNMPMMGGMGPPPQNIAHNMATDRIAQLLGVRDRHMLADTLGNLAAVAKAQVCRVLGYAEAFHYFVQLLHAVEHVQNGLGGVENSYIKGLVVCIWHKAKWSIVLMVAMAC